MRRHYLDGVDGWWALPMALAMLALIVGIVVVVVLAVRTQRREDRTPWIRTTAPLSSPAAAEQILAERFARGEIDADQYRAALAVLRGAST